MNQKGFAVNYLIIGLVILALIGGAYYFGKTANKLVTSSQQKACTQEAKICPDGSSVGRTGTNCEFSPCPTLSSVETMNWKEYFSKDSVYSFKYPSNWIFVPVSEGCGPVFYPPDTKKVWLTICGPYVNSNDTPENLAERSIGQKSEILRTSAIVDNYQGIRQELLMEDPYNYEIDLYLNKVQSTMKEASGQTDKLGTLGVYYYIQDQSKLDKAKEQFNQILSTFKFTN